MTFLVILLYGLFGLSRGARIPGHLLTPCAKGQAAIGCVSFGKLWDRTKAIFALDWCSLHLCCSVLCKVLELVRNTGPQDLPIVWNEKHWQKRLSLTVWKTVTFQNWYSEIATSLLEAKSNKRLVFQWTSQKHRDEVLWLPSLSSACFQSVHCNIFFFLQQDCFFCVFFIFWDLSWAAGLWFFSQPWFPSYIPAEPVVLLTPVNQTGRAEAQQYLVQEVLCQTGE